MTKRIVIASHAGLSKGFESSLRFIFQPSNEIYTICAFSEVIDPGKAFDELYSSFDEGDSVVVLTDLVGGSVNKMIAERLKDKQFYLISGMNLALLLEIACMCEENINAEAIRGAVERCRFDLSFVNDVIGDAVREVEENFF